MKIILTSVLLSLLSLNLYADTTSDAKGFSCKNGNPTPEKNISLDQEDLMDDFSEATFDQVESLYFFVKGIYCSKGQQKLVPANKEEVLDALKAGHTYLFGKEKDNMHTNLSILAGVLIDAKNILDDQID